MTDKSSSNGSQNCPALAGNGVSQNSTQAITEADVLFTEVLASRPARQPDLAAENKALHTLAQHLMDEPQSMLKTLVRIALDLCQADTVGVSLLETAPSGESIFRWVAIAGTLASLEQTTTPGDFSPCGTTISCNQPQLYTYPERYFTYLHHPQFPIVEGMLFPLYVDNQQLGTIWIVSHDEQRQFDLEDQRLMTSLAGFTASALRSIALRQTTEAALQREKETRAALHQSQARFEGLVANVPGMVYRYLTSKNRPHQFTFVNSRSRELLELEPETILQSADSFVKLIHPDDLLSFQMSVARAAENFLPWRWEGRIVTPSGQLKWIQGNSYAVQTAEGDVWDGILTDITERKQAEAALRNSEEKFRNMADNAPIMVWVTDPTGYCTYLSQSWYDFSGQTKATGLRFSWLDATHPDDRESSKTIFLAANDRQQAFQLEYRLRRKDGEYRTCIDAARPWFGVDGEFKGYIGSVIDIDDRKQAEAALRRSEESYRTLFESIDEGFCIIEVLFDRNDTPIDYRFLEVNPAFENQTGLQHATGKTIRQLVPALEDHWVKTYGKIALTGESLRFENCAEAMNRWFDVYAFRIGQPEERKVAILFKDISDRVSHEAEREQAEKALQASEEQSRNILESITDAFFALDQDWRFTYVNRQAERLLDRTPGDLIGKVVWEEYPGIAGSEFERAYYQAASERVASSVISFYPDHDRWYEAHVYPAADGITIYFRNVTDRVSHEAEREQLLQREQTARETAENANRIKDEFLAVLSHELRSPLNPILGWSTLLQGRKLDEAKQAQALATIQRNAKLQSQLIEDLLDVSRILQGKLSLNAVPVDLAATIGAAIETVRLAAEAKSIQVQAVLEPNLDRVLGDSTRLQQVVWNLLSNAVKFTPEGGQINIRLEHVGSYAQITVSDTGKGIHPDFLPYVFDYFRQADAATTRRFGGLGLGLAIVRHLVELHGGTVEVESPGEDRGATFTVRLPLMSTQIITNQDSKPLDLSLDLSGIKILVVDDDTDTREFTAFLLEQYGARVTVVASAAEALVVFTQFKPDVLLSDIGMPDVDGYMLIQQLRISLPQGGQIPAIALTAYAGEMNQQQALAAGFQKHISKPVEPGVLVQAISSLVRSC